MEQPKRKCIKMKKLNVAISLNNSKMINFDDVVGEKRNISQTDHEFLIIHTEY